MTTPRMIVLLIVDQHISIFVTLETSCLRILTRYLQASQTGISDIGTQDGEDVGQEREQGAKRRSKLEALVPR